MSEAEQNASIVDRFAEYDVFVEQASNWLKSRADRFHWYYNVSRISLVLLSVSIPAMTTGLFGARGEGAVPFVALIIAFLGSLDGLFMPGENWRHFRSYQLALQRFRRVSDSRRTELSLLPAGEGRNRRTLALYREFVLDIEQLLEEEAKKFFEQRIQELKRDQD